MAVNDAGIPSLDAVLHPVTMTRHLRQVLPERWGPIRDIQFQILKRHRTRCTFAISWPGPHGWRMVIGKVFAVDRADVYRAMEAIRRAGFGPDEEFSIPEPLAYIPDLRLLLQEHVPGPRAKQVLVTGSERDRAAAADRAAQWLARFQAIGPRIGEADRVDDLLQTCERWSRGVTDVGGSLAEKATRLGGELEGIARWLRPIELCAGHHHYTGGQILLSERRTATIDWDGYALADPAADAATFVVDLKRIGWKNPSSNEALGQVATFFVMKYFSLVPPAIRVNLPFYAAARCLRLAYNDVEHREAGWCEKAGAMLDEGLRILQRGL